MSGLEVVFAGLAVLAVAAGLLAVTSPRVLHCAVWLFVCLASLAGVYLVLGAEIVALIQVAIYVGAVVILVMFAMWLTKAPDVPSRELDASVRQRVAAGLAGLGVAVAVGGTLMAAVGDDTMQVDSQRGSATAIGTALFGGWVLPFELLSVLLLAALVAALAIAKESADQGAGST